MWGRKKTKTTQLKEPEVAPFVCTIVAVVNKDDSLFEYKLEIGESCNDLAQDKRAIQLAEKIKSDGFSGIVTMKGHSEYITFPASAVKYVRVLGVNSDSHGYMTGFTARKL